MDRWKGRLAVVTGASSGNGAAIAYQLQDQGLDVVALTLEADKAEEAVNNARSASQSRNRYQDTKVAPGKLYSRECNLMKEEEISAAFQWIKEKFGKVDILVNNAGISGETYLTDTTPDAWRRIVDTNLMAVAICTREAVLLMREAGINDGHVVHICSTAGHIETLADRAPMYSAAKHGVRVLTEALRKELVAKKEQIRVSCISPGTVKTGLINNSKRFTPEEFYRLHVHMFPEDLAEAVLFAIGAPPHVQIHNIIIKPVGEAC